MKYKIFTRVALVMVAIWLVGSCETDMKKAQDAYDASMVVPAIVSTLGPTLALQTFAYDFKVTYDRAGSTWTWTAVDATVQSVSNDKKTATVLFATLPANDTALVKVKETTSGGVTSPEKVLKVRVNAFCPLPVSGFVGTWTGDDGGGGGETYPGTLTTTLSGTKILVDGMNVGFMDGFWGETIVSGGTCLMTVNENGTVDIPEQFFCNTDYSDGYKIKGSGTWDNCGAKPELVINYDIWYPDNNYWIAEHYGASYLGGKTYLTATITMD